MRENDAGNFREFFAGARLERVAASVKENIRHIDDEAASGIAGLQNGIELIEELGAKLSLFGFGLRGGLARFFGFGFGGALLRLSGFAILSGFLFGGDSGLCVFLGLLFYGHDAGFFGGLHDFARGGDHGFFVAL